MPVCRILHQRCQEVRNEVWGTEWERNYANYSKVWLHVGRSSKAVTAGEGDVSARGWILTGFTIPRVPAASQEFFCLWHQLSSWVVPDTQLKGLKISSYQSFERLHSQTLLLLWYFTCSAAVVNEINCFKGFLQLNSGSTFPWIDIWDLFSVLLLICLVQCCCLITAKCVLFCCCWGVLIFFSDFFYYFFFQICSQDILHHGWTWQHSLHPPFIHSESPKPADRAEKHLWKE